MMPNRNRREYAHLAQRYIRLVRGYSPGAAAALQAEAGYDPEAVVRAAVLLMQYRNDIRSCGHQPGRDAYRVLLAHQPEVLRLFERAAETLLRDVSAVLPHEPLSHGAARLHR
jgi:hypothetical protein